MMWLEFLFDRIGGSEVFQAVFDGEKDAWSNPDAIKALAETQKLIKAGGFIKGFSSITADSNADQALLYTGKAAMMLHGAWTYGSMKNDGGDFVTGGNLGYMNFPPVDGGKGDPSDTVGNPGQYLSISSKASAEEKEVAKKFLAENTLDDDVDRRVGRVGQRAGRAGHPRQARGDQGQGRRRLAHLHLRHGLQRPRSSRSPGTRRSARRPPRPCSTTSRSCSSSTSTRRSSPTNMNAVIGK